jgi:fructose-bisphosphate aldolase class II
MYDGSKLPLEENIENTKAVVRAAHAVGVSVEAEVGHVGHGSEYASFGGQRKGFTDPNLVEKFIAETKVDFLAVAIGNAHGVYQGEPHLDFDLLREIRQRVDIPLVLHGGTGISEEQFKVAIDGGISKINIATDLYMATTKRLAERIMDDKGKPGGLAYGELTMTAFESFRERCGYYLDLFGTAGKA